MAVLSFSVGSFGDIVTILQLAWQLRAALNSASGASAEVAALINDIDEFTRGLQQVNAVIQRDATGFQPDIVNGIKHALGTCHDVLLAVERKISSFRSRMNAAKGPTVWKHYWAVAAWSILGGKEDADTLRARLAEQLSRIQFYLSLAHSNDHSAMHAHASQSEARLEQIYVLLQELPGQVTKADPSFRLFDPESNRYYQPCARTSFERLQKLVKAANQRRDPAREFGLQKPIYRSRYFLPHRCVVQMFYIRVAKMAWRGEFPDNLELGVSTWGSPVPVQCFFFEGVFQEWQVMLGVPPASATVECQQLLKVLLERKHAIGAPCDCEGVHCHVRFSGLLERAAYIKQALLAYSEAGTLLLAQVPADEDRSYWQERILAALRTYPDPEYVRDTILPFLWDLDTRQSASIEESAYGAQQREIADEELGTEHDDAQTEEASQFASEMETDSGYYSLDDMVSWLETAPELQNGVEQLDFNFMARDIRSHPRIVVQCKNIAFQMMMLL